MAEAEQEGGEKRSGNLFHHESADDPQVPY
jgi:hypothetical protein